MEAGECVQNDFPPQRFYYLTPSVVSDARVVFDRYCDFEARQRQSRDQLLTRARSMRLSPAPASGRPPARRPGARAGRVGGESPRRSEAGAAASVSGSFGEPAAGPSAEANPEAPAGERLLGVEGLQKFFRDLDVPLSALEVAELVHALEGDPVDSAAAAAVPAPVASGRTTPTRKKRSPQRVRGTKDVPREVEVAPAPVIARKGPTRNGVDFGHFIFILSHVMPEKKDISAAKNAEIDDLFRLVDNDGDGVISVEDVRAMAKNLAENEGLGDDRDIQRLLEMNDVEIEAAVMECDVDGDGRLTAEDLRSSLRP